MKSTISSKPNIHENNSGPSKLTLKNYAADTRKFIRWYELSFSRQFPPKVLTKETIDAYLKPISESSPRSALRYTSSLRKFFEYLTSEGIITYNPLALTKAKMEDKDFWRMREFKNALYNLKKSPVTIKNYLSDISQFTHWVEEIELKESIQNSGTQIDPFAKINPVLIEIYKKRLINEAGLSASSVNRKLASLRQYFSWAINSGYFKVKSTLLESFSNVQHELEDKQEAGTNNGPIIPLHALQTIQTETQKAEREAKGNAYSSLAPIRLLQKTANGFDILFDAVFVTSAIKTLENLKFGFWKITGREVFAPVSEVMKSLEMAEHISSGLNPSLPPLNSSQEVSGLDSFIRTGRQEKIKNLHGLPKSMYAPRKISIRALPVLEKIKYHLRYTRPAWYRKYHSYPLVHYVHLGIALMFAVILGFRIYQPFLDANPSGLVLAESIGPNRTIRFQGHLRDEDGLPINGTQNIRFAVYNSKTASRSALLWQEVQTVNIDQTGAFSVSLGENDPIKEEIFSQNPGLFLGISIGSNPELKPREELANFSLSANSQTLQGLKPITGNNAGTENVVLALDSSGNLTIGGNANPIFQATGGELSLSGQELSFFTNPGSNGNIVLNPDGAGIIDIRKPLQNTSEDITSSTSAALQINDNLDINATSSEQSALQINQNGIGDLISAGVGGSAKFTVSNSGTATIGEDLRILGNNISTVTGTFRIADTTTKHIYIGGAAEEIFLGGTDGTTTINHNLKVQSMVTAVKGLSLPYLEPGSITFLSDKDELTADIKNLFWDNKNKRLGLGTNLPANKLTVIDNIAASGRAAGSVTNLNTTDSANNVALRLNLGVDTAGTQARFMTFYAKCQTISCTGSAKGNIAVTASGVAYNSGSADFAEYFKKANPNELFKEGDLICFAKTEGVERCGAESNGLLGAYSKDAGFVGASNYENNPDYVLVGLIGQLRVNISEKSEEIKAGDPIGLGNGSAIKATRAGQIVGRALESFDPSNQNNNLIKIALNVSWFDPEAILMNDGRLATAYQNPQLEEDQKVLNSYQLTSKFDEYAVKSIQEFLDTLRAGVLKTKSISTESLTIATENVTIGAETLREYITRIVNEVLDERLAAIANGKNEAEKEELAIINPIADEIISSPSPIISPTPDIQPKTSSPQTEASDSAELISTSYPLEPNLSVTNITNIYNNISTGSAEIASTSANPESESEISRAPDVTPTPLASVSSTPMPQESTTPLYQGFEGQADNTSFPSPDTLNFQDALDISKVASFSADLSYVPNLRASLGRFDNGLIALGPTSLTDVTVSTQISVGDNLKISNTAIDTIGTDLNLQPLRQGSLRIMSGLVTIDTKGNLTVEGNAEFAQDVNVRGRLATGIISPLAGSDSVKIEGNLTASGSAKFTGIETGSIKLIRGAQADTSFTETVASGSAGTATITTNEIERTVMTPFVTKDSLIYITPVTDTKGAAPYLARQTAEDPASGTRGSFTIQIPVPQPFDIKLNWWIIN